MPNQIVANSMSSAAVVSLALVLTACVPIPHRSNLTPSVAGSVTSHGVPVPSASLRLVAAGNASPCDGMTRDFKTTDEGLFYAPPIRQFNFVMVPMAHRFFPWALCLKREDRWEVLHQDRTWTIDAGLVWLEEISCDEGTGWQCESKQNWNPSPGIMRELEKRSP